MMNVCFFITHKTLDYNHANATLWSIGNQVIRDAAKMDVLYIYNTHQDELSNDEIVKLCMQHGVDRVVKEIRIFDYDNNTPKTLGSDISTITRFMKENYEHSDRVLILKSDCVLSKNYFDEILHLPDGDVFFTAPFICAKQRISDKEIFEYAARDTYVRSDDITFFVEDKYNSSDNDFNNRPGVDVTDESIRFTSCEVIQDFSCHFLTNWLSRRMSIHDASWGGVKFGHMLDYHIGTDRCFVIHKYHGIVSENRSTDREGPVKEWLAS